jgi:predicted AlkP superfamily pyrophosphatase or phosphodiesterase
VLWPVTGGAKEIRYNIPELIIQPGQNQVIENLREGSKLPQLKLLLRHRKLLNGTGQPALDRFTAACSADIIRQYKPDLVLVHFTSFDSLCHKNGENLSALEPAFQTMDEGLGLLLDAAGNDAQVILFSDHAQLDVHKTVLPNVAFADSLQKNNAFIECCAGSAFLHPGNASSEKIEQIKNRVLSSEGFARFLTAEELQVSGRGELPFGFCALPGYTFENTDSGYKGQHGYPLDYENYKVFYMARGFGIPQGKTVHGGSLLDIAPLALRMFAAEGCNLDMSDLPL